MADELRAVCIYTVHESFTNAAISSMRQPVSRQLQGPGFHLPRATSMHVFCPTGTWPNAVKTQIWIAISVYVLVAILKKRLGLDQSLYTIVQILSVTLLEKIPILQAFQEQGYKHEQGYSSNQLLLFN